MSAVSVAADQVALVALLVVMAHAVVMAQEAAVVAED